MSITWAKSIETFLFGCLFGCFVLVFYSLTCLNRSMVQDKNKIKIKIVYDGRKEM